MSSDLSAVQAWAEAALTPDQILTAMTKGFLRAATETPAGRDEIIATLRSQGYTVIPPTEEDGAGR